MLFYACEIIDALLLGFDPGQCANHLFVCCFQLTSINHLKCDCVVQAVRMHTAFTGRDTMSRDIIIDMTTTQVQ